MMTDEEYRTWYLAEAERNACAKNELHDLGLADMLTEAARNACDKNKHGDRHCWHWLDGPPRLDGHPLWWAIARCCWCGTERRFTYEDVIYGRVPVTPSSGAVHGTRPMTTTASEMRELPK